MQPCTPVAAARSHHALAPPFPVASCHSGPLTPAALPAPPCTAADCVPQVVADFYCLQPPVVGAPQDAPPPPQSASQWQDQQLGAASAAAPSISPGTAPAGATAGDAAPAKHSGRSDGSGGCTSVAVAEAMDVDGGGVDVADAAGPSGQDGGGGDGGAAGGGSSSIDLTAEPLMDASAAALAPEAGGKAAGGAREKAGGADAGRQGQGPAGRSAPDIWPEGVTPELEWRVRHVVLPALRAFLKPPRRRATDGSVIQVASLERMYRVFERC